MSTRIGILIDLDDLERLQRIYINEVQADLQQQLTLSLFLQWLLKRQKDDKANGKTTISGSENTELV